MDYQKKLLTEEQISNIYVAEGDIVSFFDKDGKFCTKDSTGNIVIIQDKINQLDNKIEEFKEEQQEVEVLLEDINDILGGGGLLEEEEQVSTELLSIL